MAPLFLLVLGYVTDTAPSSVHPLSVFDPIVTRINCVKKRERGVSVRRLKRGGGFGKGG